MLKNQLKKQLKNNKGFTLAELLIVVAIIAILVAISVPVFTGKLEESRTATDKANMRAAKSAALTEYLSLQEIDANKEYYFNAETGKLVESNSGIAAYGQSKEPITGATNAPKGNVLKIVVETNGDVIMSWVAPGASE